MDESWVLAQSWVRWTNGDPRPTFSCRQGGYGRLHHRQKEVITIEEPSEDYLLLESGAYGILGFHSVIKQDLIAQRVAMHNYGIPSCPRSILNSGHMDEVHHHHEFSKANPKFDVA
jgi:hypothetical protein